MRKKCTTFDPVSATFAFLVMFCADWGVLLTDARLFLYCWDPVIMVHDLPEVFVPESTGSHHMRRFTL